MTLQLSELQTLKLTNNELADKVRVCKMNWGGCSIVGKRYIHGIMIFSTTGKRDKNVATSVTLNSQRMKSYLT